MVGITVISGRETAAQAPEFPLHWAFCLEPGPGRGVGGRENRPRPGKFRHVAQTARLLRARGDSDFDPELFACFCVLRPITFT